MAEPLLHPPGEAMRIIDALRSAGHTAYFCGGCVRDALMGRPPKDYDIATSAAPDAVEKLFSRTVPVGRNFGVMIVVAEDGENYEVATFRSDGGYVDGRHPDSIHFASPQEDAQRRDFTINALFYDPSADAVIDYVGGRDDIAAKLIRTVGSPRQRFSEDKLRLLRAIRFAARTGFSIETATFSAIRQLAGEVGIVSPERIAAELESMLLGGASRAAFALLKQTGLLATVLPEVDALAGVAQPPDFHPEGDVWIHTLDLLAINDAAINGVTAAIDYSSGEDGLAPRNMYRGDFTGAEYLAGVAECRAALDEMDAKTLAWSGLLHDIGKPATFTVSDRIRFNDHDRLGAEMAESVLERLRRPRRVIELAFDLIRRHIHFSTLPKMRRSKLRRWLAAPSFPAHLELHRLDCVASHRMLANWYFGLQAWREEKARPPEPEPLLRGSDLLELGIQPGPLIGKILRQVDDARLEGAVIDKKGALMLANRLFRNEEQHG
ncbi:MAG: HD domain-containing protein [Planctomycetes bacterium]|nr:HD domain-containing protein [Planctomycetota bacterium]